MNLLKKITKFCMSVIVLIIMTMLSNQANAQKQYTSISKNINPEAQNLYHDLSPQGDTLYLKAESIFYKVTFLNSLDRKIYNFNPPVLEAKISLHDIIVGDYTVLVYKKDRIIVFHISRLEEIEKPFEILASKEIIINNDVSIVEPINMKILSKERLASRSTNNEIKIDEQFELGMSDLKVALIDENLNIDNTNLITKIRAYDLSSLDRRYMQSRDEYRRNNLRPNGKTYN